MNRPKPSLPSHPSTQPEPGPQQGAAGDAVREPEAELEDVLPDVAAETGADVEQVVRLAAAEARLEAAVAGLRPAFAAVPSPGPTTAADVEVADELDACFDADDLANAMDGLGSASASDPEGAPAPRTEEPTASGPDSILLADSATPGREPAAAVTSCAVVPQATGDLVVAQAMERVERFLGELRQSLLEIARPAPATAVAPPQPEPLDLAPLVRALQAGIERTTPAAAATPRVVPATYTGPGDRLPMVLLAVAILVAAWSMVFWVKTGSPSLALGTLVGANLVGCCLLASWRSRR